jgi:hypothetical protein
MEEEEILLDLEKGSKKDKKKFDPDLEYGDQCGYPFIKAMRGSSIGRQTKRCIFYLSLVEILYGIPVFIMSVYEDVNLDFVAYFTGYSQGSSLLGLQYGTSFLALFFGTLGMLAARNWATMVTNRELLVNTLNIYQGILLLLLILTIVTIAKIFHVFRNIDWSSITGALILPLYICTMICLFPFLFGLAYYLLEISFLSESIHYGADITEPEPLPDHFDLTGLTLTHICMAVVALPFLAFEQCREGAEYLWTMAETRVKKGVAKARERHKKAAKQRSGLWKRINKTISRFFGDFFASMKERKKMFEDQTPLAGLTDAKDSLEADAAQMRLQKLIAEKTAREAAEREERERREREEREAAMAPYLSARAFKSLWTSLGSAGSFQCELKIPATQEKFVEHIRRQNFHVVFVGNPDAGGFEVGVCNTRENGTGPWFMTRFLTNEKTFSAVMKCEDPSVVTSYVKRFSLAKVLRISIQK